MDTRANIGAFVLDLPSWYALIKTPITPQEASRGLVRVCPFVGPSRHREFTVGRHRLLHWNAATAPALLNIGYDVIDDSGSFMANDKRDPLLDLTDYLL